MFDKERFRRLRERAGLSQTELAAKAGIDNNTISGWERGKCPHPRRSNLAKAAAAMGLGLDALLGEAAYPEIAGELPGERAALLQHYASLSPEQRFAATTFITTWAEGGTLLEAYEAARHSLHTGEVRQEHARREAGRRRRDGA